MGGKMNVDGVDMSMETWGQYWSANVSLYILLGFVISLMVAMVILERKWRNWQNRLAKATDKMAMAQSFSADLVRHFMPSFEFQKYQFRGIQRKSRSVDIAFDDLALELPGGHRVLKGVSGEFQGGRISAIMGPSGAGKTSFMNVLCGKATYGKQLGEVRLNGKVANIGELKGVVGFVPQDDIVFENLTVREQLEFSARLRNDTSVSARRIRYIVDDVLNIMWLSNIQTSLVGGIENRGISGGQRKRVNIGLELVAQPSVLFLDEPTTGLDATSSLFVAASLKRLGALGMTSIMVIHQPRYSLFTLIDDVLLLGRGGSTVYLGPAADVKNYFENLGFAMPQFENPADWFMDIISGTVENRHTPSFTQEMLFQRWETRTKEEKNAREQFRLSGRSLTRDDALAVLRDALDQEWDRIDGSKHGLMDEVALQELLATCSAVIPDVEIVRDLMYRMAGEGADHVTKEQFLAYLCSLSEEIAHDASSPTQGDVRQPLHNMCNSDHSDSPSDSSSDGDSDDSADDEDGGLAKSYNPMARQLPNCGKQLNTMLLRRIVQWWRFQKQRCIFLVALIFGASFFGVLDRYWSKQELWDATPLLYLQTALALLLSIFSLHVFGHDQPVFWRERARGMNMFAFFVSRLVVNALDLLILTLAFTATYYIIRQPEVPYWCWMTPFLFTAMGASGWGYFISAAINPANGPFVVTLVVFVTCALLGNFSNLYTFLQGGMLEIFIGLVSLSRWTVQMSFVYVVSELDPNPTDLKSKLELALEKNVYMKRDYDVGFWAAGACGALVQTAWLYVVSFICLRFRNRHKMV